MNTATYHNNHFISDRLTIFKIYIQEYFFFEIIPLIFERLKTQYKVLNFIFHATVILKVKGMLIIMEKLEFYILQLIEKDYFIHLAKLLGQILIAGHLIACLWYIIGEFERDYLNDN
jgi:hypothetical protein